MPNEQTAPVATPAKLRDGSWGVRVLGTAHPGMVVTIQARSGKSWPGTVAQVLWTGNGVSLCSTTATKTPPRTQVPDPNPRPSTGYKNGMTVGGYARASRRYDSRYTAKADMGGYDEPACPSCQAKAARGEPMGRCCAMF